MSTLLTLPITITSGNNPVTSGSLAVTLAKITTAIFTPTGGTWVQCGGVVWDVGPNGHVNFFFKVHGQANGGFPLGPGGRDYTYTFTGQQNANGSSPSGTVNFPSATAAKKAHTGSDIDQTDTWQAGAGEEVPHAKRKGA